MARPKASDARDTRQEILDAALDLFAEKGFSGTSLRDIARAVGIREGAIYHYFESKELLFEAITAPPQKDGPERVDQLIEQLVDADVAEGFEKLSVALLERFATMRERKVFRLVMNDGMRLAAQGRWDYWQRMGAYREPLERAMDQMIRKARLLGESPEQLALLYVAPLLLWRQLQVLSPDHPFVSDYRAFARRHVEQFLAGAAVPMDRPPRKWTSRAMRRIGKT